MAFATCRAVVAAALTIGVAGSAIASTASGTLSVRVVVQPNCTVSSTTLDFGTYVSTQAAALNGTANLAYTNCPAGTLKFEFDGGANGTVTARKMSNGAGGLLNYGLYRDTARTQNFAQGTSAKTVTLAATGSGTVPVYGAIPGAQAVAEGTYTDTVHITLTF